MTFTFENEMGIFKLFGSGRNGFLVCSVSGLEPVEHTRSVKTYIGEDGCFEDSSQYVQRIITLSCDMRLDENSKRKIRNAMRVLSRKCKLIIESDDSKRQITVNSATLTFGKKYPNFQTFVIQLTCDYPHFCDIYPTECTVFKKNKLLTSQSTLPALFSTRISGCVVDNMGDLKIYPVITIKKNDDIIRENEIVIENKTIDKSIILNKAMVKDEIVTVDIKNRTITSSVYGNILGTLGQYSSLSEFWCECDENEINVFLDGAQTGMEIQVSYFNEYLEAI